jgi:hypothetical protein
MIKKEKMKNDMLSQGFTENDLMEYGLFSSLTSLTNKISEIRWGQMVKIKLNNGEVVVGKVINDGGFFHKFIFIDVSGQSIFVDANNIVEFSIISSPSSDRCSVCPKCGKPRMSE